MTQKLEQFKLEVLDELKFNELQASEWSNNVYDLGFEHEGYEVWLSFSDVELEHIFGDDVDPDETFFDVDQHENLTLVFQHMRENLHNVSIYYYTKIKNIRREILDDIDLYDMLLQDF